jgi:HAMP domain-containing protein
VPATSGQTIRGALRITYPATAVTDRTAQAWWILTGVGLAVLLIAAAVAFGLARWMTRPVRELEAATTRLASGTLETPPPTDLGPPELRRLAATFTDTAGRLQQLIAAQRSFAADASHQLKPHSPRCGCGWRTSNPPSTPARCLAWTKPSPKPTGSPTWSRVCSP